MAQHNEFGKIAEKKAVHYLINKNYQILEVNWRTLRAEIDIVCAKQDLLVIVEVKARQIESKNYGVLPHDAINIKKKKRLIFAADAYIQEKELDLEVRFDIISIFHSNGNWEINHIKDSFNAAEV